jgi:hypothetical protein
VPGIEGHKRHRDFPGYALCSERAEGMKTNIKGLRVYGTFSTEDLRLL